MKIKMFAIPHIQCGFFYCDFVLYALNNGYIRFIIFEKLTFYISYTIALIFIPAPTEAKRMMSPFSRE
jgi:hypothetical protein